MRPLEGLLVVSMEQAVAAPTCSLKLADAGARVIKIERAEGDFALAGPLVEPGNDRRDVLLRHRPAVLVTKQVLGKDLQGIWQP